MEEFEQKENYEIIREKMKERPINRRKLMKRTMLTLSMAVLFGVFACLTFLVLEPVFSNLLYPKPEQELVELPEYTEEMLPEDMIITKPENNTDETVVTSVKKDDEYLSDYLTTMQTVYDLVKENRKTIVDVTAVSSEMDWFNNEYENTGHTKGIIVANKNGDLYILVMAPEIEEAESITVEFQNGTIGAGSYLNKDSNTGLTIITVDVEKLSKETLAETKVAVLGSSRPEALLATPVIAMGNPLGKEESVAYGMITSKGNTINLTDHNYEILTTDIYGSEKGSGFLYNFAGEVIGVIDQNHNRKDVKNLITAVGISELKATIEKLSNNGRQAYLGIYGIDVTEEANMELGVPMGAYVKNIEMGSPAMKAGIQSGDVICKIDETIIESFSQYSSCLFTYNSGDMIDLTIKRQKNNEYQEIVLRMTLK